MPLNRKEIGVLIIEDNTGDYVLIDEYLRDEIPYVKTHRVTTFGMAKDAFAAKKFDVVLLDLTLPDCSGLELIHETLQMAGNSPIIVLTGYADRTFSIKTLSLGVSDYLLKDELTSSHLFKSIFYSIERKKVNFELRRSEEKYRTLFQSSPIPMWVYDQDTLAFLDVNSAAIRHYGYSNEEFLAMTIKDIRPAGDIQKVQEVVKATKDSRDFFEGIFTHFKKNGAAIKANIQSNTIDFSGKTARLVLANDVTEKIKIQQERENLIFELVQTIKDLRQFSFITSHNLRAPIAQLLGLTNLLDSCKVEDPMALKIIEGIKTAAATFDETVRDLSSVLEIKDRPSVPVEELMLDNVMEKILLQCEPIITDSKAQVALDFSKEPCISFSKAYMESILTHLLTNAIKYSSKDRVPAISITTESAEEETVLTFSDNGQGIDLAVHRDKIFGLYQKFHDRVEGKGLGLFLIKTQMEALNGSIEVQSELDKGTTFILRFRKASKPLRASA